LCRIKRGALFCVVIYTFEDTNTLPDSPPLVIVTWGTPTTGKINRHKKDYEEYHKPKHDKATA
jgi:hypothetical protein